MASWDIGMDETIAWIKDNMKEGDTALDVGACDGKWADWINGYLTLDAIEIFEPYVEKYNLLKKYREVFVSDIVNFEYEHYDLVIFGDVLEHLTVENAQKVINYAKKHATHIIVVVPYYYKQEPYDDNEYERHIQDDLNEEIFDERYPGFEILEHPAWNYTYYHCLGNKED